MERAWGELVTRSERCACGMVRSAIGSVTLPPDTASLRGIAHESHAGYDRTEQGRTEQDRQNNVWNSEKRLPEIARVNFTVAYLPLLEERGGLSGMKSQR